MCQKSFNQIFISFHLRHICQLNIIDSSANLFLTSDFLSKILRSRMTISHRNRRNFSCSFNLRQWRKIEIMTRRAISFEERRKRREKKKEISTSVLSRFALRQSGKNGFHIGFTISVKKKPRNRRNESRLPLPPPPIEFIPFALWKRNFVRLAK